MNKDGEKEGKRSKRQRKDNKLTKVNNPRVNEKGGKADDISKEFPNFSVLTEEERLVFFEALTAARKNVESRGVPTRDRFGTVHDQYLEYFNRQKKDEIIDELPESNDCVVDDGSIHRDSSILDSGEPTCIPSGTPSTPNLLPEGDSRPKSSLPDGLEPLLWKQCESVIEGDTAKMVDMYLKKKRKKEQKRGWKAPNQQNALAFQVSQKPLRETPRFDALNDEEKEIFFKVLQEARNNVVVKNKERKDEILPLDAIVRRYRRADVYANVQEPQKPAQEKNNLRVKVTLTSKDNERIEKTKQRSLTDREKKNEEKEHGQDVQVQRRIKPETKPKTPPAEKELSVVKKKLSCECVEGKPEKVTDGRTHGTETNESGKLKERNEVKGKVSCECVERKPQEAKPEKVTDGKTPRTGTDDSDKLKKRVLDVVTLPKHAATEPQTTKEETNTPKVRASEPVTTEKEPNTPEDETQLKTKGQKREEVDIETCEAENPKETKKEFPEDENPSEKEQLEMQDVERRLRARPSYETVPEQHRTPKTKKKNAKDKETLTAQVSLVETSEDNVEEVEYRSEPCEAATEDVPTCEERTQPNEEIMESVLKNEERMEPSEGIVESVPEYGERTEPSEGIVESVLKYEERMEPSEGIVVSVPEYGERTEPSEGIVESVPENGERTEPSQGIAEYVPQYQERAEIVGEVDYETEPREAITEDVPTYVEEAQEAQKTNCETELGAEDEGIAVHGVTGGENLVGGSWEEEGFQSSQAKVMIVDDNVIEEIRKLIYYLEAKTKKDSRLEREYIKLLVDYVAYLSKVMEVLVRKKKSQHQQVHRTFTAAQIKFIDEKSPQEEPKTRTGRSVSAQDVRSDSVGVTSETTEAPKGTDSETLMIFSSGSEDSLDEPDIRYLPPPQQKRKVVTTKVRLLQDLLKHRAEFVEGSTEQFKIVQLPDPEYIPLERPPTVKLISEEDEGDPRGDDNILRKLMKCFTCGRKRDEDDGIYQNLKGEAVRVDVDEGKKKDAANATLNQATMEVLKAAGRKRIIEKYYGEH